MYANLKLQLFCAGIHQSRLARDLGIEESLLSRIIRGYRRPTFEQRRKMAEYLNVSEAWLFETQRGDFTANQSPDDGNNGQPSRNGESS